MQGPCESSWEMHIIKTLCTNVKYFLHRKKIVMYLDVYELVEVPL